MANDKFKVSLTLEAFTKGFDEINSNLAALDQKTKKLSEGFTKFGQKLTIGLTAPIAIFAATAIRAFGDQEKNIAKFTDSFEKQGGRIGETFDGMTKDAESFAGNTLFQADDILGGVTSQLLSFTQINKSVFKDAEKVIIDFAAKTGTDLSAATLEIGKALQNPTEGLNLLRRSGVAVTDSQIDMISKLDKAGKSAEAQAGIIKILNDQYGGFAEKIANTDTGKLQLLQKTFKELQENFGEAFLKVFRPVIEFLTDFLREIDKLTPASKVIIAFFLTITASIGPLLLIIGQLSAALVTLGIPLLAIAGPVGLLALLASGLILASEKFGTLTNAANNFALQINKDFLVVLNLIEKIPGVFELLIPGIGLIKDASSALKTVVESNIASLSKTIDNFIIEQQNKPLPLPSAANAKPEPTQAELDLLKKRAEFLAQADKELREKAFESVGAINDPVMLDQVALFDPKSKFSELTVEVRQLTEAGQIFTNSFTNAFTNMVTGAESASQAIKNLGRSLLQAFANAILQRAFASIFSGIAGLGQTTTVPAGNTTPGLFGHAEGGFISGPGGPTSDSIMARLSNGEFVMRADAVKKFGVNFMHMLNRGIMPAFANGGIMKNFGSYLNHVPRFATGGIVNAQQPSVNVNVINNSSQPVTARSTQSVDVRGAVVNIILEDLKTNGPISQGNQQAFGLRR